MVASKLSAPISLLGSLCSCSEDRSSFDLSLRFRPLVFLVGYLRQPLFDQSYHNGITRLAEEDSASENVLCASSRFPFQFCDVP